jgi:hypothetical protein
MKPEKLSSARGVTLYRIGKWSVSITRKTISEKRGCGLRSYYGVSGWYAINMENPLAESHSGYGGMRDAVLALKKLS